MSRRNLDVATVGSFRTEPLYTASACCPTMLARDRPYGTDRILPPSLCGTDACRAGNSGPLAAAVRLCVPISVMRAVFDNQDAVGTLDGRKPVGNDKAGAVCHQRLHALLNQILSEGVHRTGGLVHDKDLWLGQHSACQTDQLLLAQLRAACRLRPLLRHSPFP